MEEWDESQSRKGRQDCGMRHALSGDIEEKGGELASDGPVPRGTIQKGQLC